MFRAILSCDANVLIRGQSKECSSVFMALVCTGESGTINNAPGSLLESSPRAVYYPYDKHFFKTLPYGIPNGIQVTSRCVIFISLCGR